MATSTEDSTAKDDVVIERKFDADRSVRSSRLSVPSEASGGSTSGGSVYRSLICYRGRFTYGDDGYDAAFPEWIDVTDDHYDYRTGRLRG